MWKEAEMVAKSVDDLEVYKLAFDLQRKIFRLTKTFPREEMYSLTDQVRRSSRSVGANIREAWAKRRYPAHFVSKLSDSMVNRRKPFIGFFLHMIVGASMPPCGMNLKWSTGMLAACLTK